MLVRTLKIKGYRSLRDVTWSPGSLDVVIGPNGSGKSNLLGALALLRCAARGDLADELARLGGLGPLLWDGRSPGLSWQLETERLGPEDTDAEDDEPRPALHYLLELKRTGQGSAYRIERERLDRTESASSVPLPPLIDAVPARAIVRLPPREAFFNVPPEDRSDERPLLATMSGPDAHATTARFREQLARIAIYQDIDVRPGAPLRQPAVARMERELASDGQNLVSVLHTLYAGDRDLKKTMDEALRAGVGPDYEELVFAPAADQRVELRLRMRSLRTAPSAADLSGGTLRFLLLLAICLSPSPRPLVAIDALEAGLHPRMLRVVAQLARDASRRTRVVLVTSSPEVLHAFDKAPPAITIAACADGETRLETLDGSEVEHWLAAYLGRQA